jgi:molybdopterin-containing oxidoreductase family iron-sulfur binding subunit
MSDDGVDRREFLRLAGASIALAGLDGCTRMPAEHILPYVDNRPELTPGVGQYYATALCVDGLATGVIVESHDGRPTKIEGNPEHPASLGAAGVLEQAAVLQLYDPDRARYARLGKSRSSRATIARMLAPDSLRARVGPTGKGLRLLLAPTTSPLDEELLAQVISRYPDARVHMYAPMVADRAATPFVDQYDVSRADVILAVDSDFLASGPFHLRYARQFADGRRLEQPTDAMNRLYVIESSFTPTGSAADHRFAVRPSDIPATLRAVLAALGDVTTERRAGEPWEAAIARDLRAHAGRGVVVVGQHQAGEVRALGDAINDAIGAHGRTTWRTPNPLIGARVAIHPFDELLGALRAREVDTLIIVGGNPSYTTPAALDFPSLLRMVPNLGYLGLYENETAAHASWFLPMSHALETWGDARAHDGTTSIVQPLVKPLYDSMSPAELLAAIAGVSPDQAEAYVLLRASWSKRTGSEADAAWQTALRSGTIAGTAFAPTAVGAASASNEKTINTANVARSGERGAIDVVYRADPKVHDGAFANNGWLQELPAPLTQLAWGNAALISPSTARRLNVSTGDVVLLAVDNRRLETPALVLPGHADDTVTLHLGYGRAGAERLARGVGANAYAMWPSIGHWSERNGSLTKQQGTKALSIVQTHSALEASQPVRRATIADYRASPSSVGQRAGRVLSLFPGTPSVHDPAAPNEWAMTIDLSTCIGCGACSVACQAENNIPVVGADEVANGRAMHWIRIDRYFAPGVSGTPGGDIEALHQPMLCQHCEKAPCEYVCPVEATVHSDDGLNEMVYNRCVGTRFCSNNCPYKVRRFNWFDYNAQLSETELMVKNPNVSVRERGVIEKCTFCVQRIREAEIAAGREDRALRGSEVRTACQQACPTNAIVFGSLTDRDSAMVRRREQPRSYSALHDLGTEPRVKYLARIRNPNPDIQGST